MDVLNMPHARSLWQCVGLSAVTMIGTFVPFYGMGSIFFGGLVFVFGIMIVSLPGWFLDGLHAYDSSPMRVVRILGWLQLIVVPVIAVATEGAYYDAGHVVVIMFWYYVPIALLTGGETMYRLIESIRNHYKSEESIANFYDGLGFDSDEDADKPGRWDDDMEEEEEDDEQRDDESRAGEDS